VKGRIGRQVHDRKRAVARILEPGPALLDQQTRPHPPAGRRHSLAVAAVHASRVVTAAPANSIPEEDDERHEGRRLDARTDVHRRERALLALGEERDPRGLVELVLVHGGNVDPEHLRRRHERVEIAVRLQFQHTSPLTYPSPGRYTVGSFVPMTCPFASNL